MLNLFKKLLGKKDAPAVPVPRVVARATPQAVHESFQPIAQVEVAHLSLSAILGKLPEDLKKTVSRMPDASATVDLPMATIHKQLPTGSVKMSLASLYRQAPAGTFSQTRTEDRRMVEVPLSEIFRHVKAGNLPRREQRALDVPDDAPGLFSDVNNPYALAPGAPEPAAAPPRASAAPQARAIPAPKELRGSSPARPLSPAPSPRVIAPPPAFASPAAAVPAPISDEPPLVLPIAQLAEQWPEPIRSEALALNGATVSLPTATVTSGLAKGKVTFSWGQIRAWLEPAAENPTEGRENTELVLPLKVVAPAFLAHSRPATPRKTFDLDPTIPALFSGGTAAPEAPAEETTVEETPVEEVPAAAEPAEAAPAPVVPEAIAPPADLAPAPVETPATEPAPEQSEAPAAEPVEEPVEEPLASVEAPATPAPAAEETPAAPTPPPTPAPVEKREEKSEAIASLPAPETRPERTVGEILGQPDKTDWSPPELVRATVKLPGVAGAVVALQEGLLVAAELPEEMKGDTVAAFLPQIFARLNNYAGEMKLGAVEDILFTSQGRLFQIYRLGEVYFAVLGKAGEKLPSETLRLIAEEVGGHHQK